MAKDPSLFVNSIVNVNFPYGTPRNESFQDAGDGTPVNRDVISDLIQTFAQAMNEAGISYNNKFDNVTDGHQYLDALKAIFVAKGSGLIVENGNLEVLNGSFEMFKGSALVGGDSDGIFRSMSVRRDYTSVIYTASLSVGDIAKTNNFGRFFHNSPTQKISLQLDVDNQKWLFMDDADTEIMTLLGTGNLGISNNNPAYNLDVTGDINFTGQLLQNGSIFSPPAGGADGYSLGLGATGFPNLNYYRLEDAGFFNYNDANVGGVNYAGLMYVAGTSADPTSPIVSADVRFNSDSFSLNATQTFINLSANPNRLLAINFKSFAYSSDLPIYYKGVAYKSVTLDAGESVYLKFLLIIRVNEGREPRWVVMHEVGNPVYSVNEVFS